MKNDKMRMLKADIIDCWVQAEKERDEAKERSDWFFRENKELCGRLDGHANSLHQSRKINTELASGVADLKKTAAEATDLAAEFNRELHEIDAENDRLKIRVRSLLDFIDTFRTSP